VLVYLLSSDAGCPDHARRRRELSSAADPVAPVGVEAGLGPSCVSGDTVTGGFGKVAEEVQGFRVEGTTEFKDERYKNNLICAMSGVVFSHF
jgi:hypothetical protein